jgi:hypothetical protein
MSDTYRELFLDKQNQLLNAMQKALQLQEELNEIEKFHPRAVKLIRKRRNFLVVSEYEPYFMKAYELIRDHEWKMGTWSDDDQRAFETAKNHRLPCGHHYHALVHPLLGTPYCNECLKTQSAAEHSVHWTGLCPHCGSELLENDACPRNCPRF